MPNTSNGEPSRNYSTTRVHINVTMVSDIKMKFDKQIKSGDMTDRFKILKTIRVKMEKIPLLIQNVTLRDLKIIPDRQ